MKAMKYILNHPTSALLGVCRWVTERVSEDVMIGVLCVGMLVAAFAL